MTTGIQIISSTIVKASNPENGAQKIELTPWDLQFLFMDYIQRGFLFQIPDLKELNEELDIANIFKTSLSNTLNHFSPLAGRLATVCYGDDTVSYSLDCNNAGALFVYAATDEVTTRDINEVGYVPSIVDSFFQLNGVQNCMGTTKPLLAVQVTKLVDGVFLCISANHVVVDGSSFFNFFSYWMGMTKGSSSLSKPRPVLERWFLNPTDSPIRIPRSYFNQMDDENEFVVNSSSSHDSALKARVFHFSKEVIAKLKAKANEEVVGTKDREISSLQASLSHLWQSIFRNKNINPDEETTYCLLIDTRQRLIKELSQGYFGNALQVGNVTMKAKELLDNGLGNAAWKMNTMIASYNEEKLRDWLESWTKCPKINRVSNLAGRNAIVTSDSPRFKFYGVESRLGKPIAVRSGPANKCDGKITVRSGVEEGSIDIEVILPLETIQAMENDMEFMDVVTTKS